VKMSRIVPAVLIVCLIAAGVASAQTDPQPDVSSPLSWLPLGIPPGIHLYNVSVASSYYSAAYGVEPGVPMGTGNAAPAYILQGSGQVGWSKAGPNSTLSITYSPTLMQGLQASHYRSFDQSLNLVGSYKLNSHWTVETAFQAGVADYTQMLFGSTLYGNLAASPTPLSGIASSITSPSTLLQLAGETPGAVAPGSSFAYGTRQVSAASTLSFVYAASTRSSYTFSLQGNYSQYLDSQTGAAGTPVYLLPKTTSVGPAVGWSYLLDPRTTFSVQATSTRVLSRYENVYNTQGSVSVSRMLTQRWFTQGMVGVGSIVPLNNAPGISSGPQQEYGGSLGYKFGSQSLLGSFNRSVSDVYGLGAYASESSSGAWNYHRTGATIALSGAFGYTRLLGPAFPNWSTWTAHFSVSKNLDRHTAVSLSYSFMQYPQTIFLQAPNLSENGLLLSMSWTPTPRR
jgi:hypothetical protein